jgi:hypothetical protein
MVLLHLLERTNQVRNPRNPHMLRGTSRGLRDSRGNWRRPALGQNDAINTCAVGRSQQRPQVMRIFDPIKSEKESVLFTLSWSQQILDPQELPLPDDRQHTLVGIRSRQPGKLVSRLN